MRLASEQLSCIQCSPFRQLCTCRRLATQVEYDDEVVDEVPAADMPGPQHNPAPRQKTRADHNKQQRKRELQQIAQRREAVKKQRRDMDSLQVLQAEITEMDAHIAQRSIRRQV